MKELKQSRVRILHIKQKVKALVVGPLVEELCFAAFLIQWQFRKTGRSERFGTDKKKSETHRSNGQKRDKILDINTDNNEGFWKANDKSYMTTCREWKI